MPSQMRPEIQTLWRTTSEQCELVSSGLSGCRLRLWVRGSLLIDEDVFDWQQGMNRAMDLLSNRSHLVRQS